MSNILAQQNFASGFVRSAIASLKGRQTKEPVPEARLRLVLTEPQGRGGYGSGASGSRPGQDWRAGDRHRDDDPDGPMTPAEAAGTVIPFPVGRRFRGEAGGPPDDEGPDGPPGSNPGSARAAGCRASRRRRWRFEFLRTRTPVRWLAAALVFAAAIALHPGLASTTQVEGQRLVATLTPESEHLPVPTQAYKILVNFTEDVNDFTTSDIAVVGGEVASGTLGRTGADRRAWRFTVYPYPEDQELLIRLPADAVKDDDGNGNALAEWRSAMGQVSDAILVSLDPATVREGQAGTEITATVSLNHAPRDVVSYARLEFGDAGDGAVRNQDYRAPDRQVVTIPAGQKSVTTTFTVTPINDSAEENSETLTVRGIMPSMTQGSAILTILDDDAASTSVSLSLDPDSMMEDAGSVSVEVTAALNAATRPGTTIVSVTVGASGDGASRSADFTAPTAVTVTIPAGQTDGTATFTLTPVDDELAEGAEEITVQGTASGLSVDDATLTLNDDDTASTSVSLSLDTASVSEDDTAQQIEVTAELNEQAGTEPTAVNVTVGRAGDTAASGTDYTPVAGFVLTIPAGQTTGTATFSLAPDDDELAEGAEEITVHGTASGLSVEDAALTLNDDDTASTSVSLSLDPASVSEDAGTVSLAVTATLDQQASPEPIAVTLTVGRTGDAAEYGTDYTSVADYVRVVLTIPGGETTGTATFTLTPVDDELAEGPETITVQGTASGLSVDDATLTLNDDDTASPSVSLSVSPASVSEDAGSVSVEVTAEFNGAVRPTPTAVNISVGSAGDSAAFGTDYTPVAGFVLTIPAGQTTGTATFSLAPDDDEVAEGPEEITVRGTASGFTVDDATLTLNDDDTASTSVSLSLDPGSVSEDAGSVSLKVTATLDQQASPEPTAVTLTVGRTGDAAESGTDYTSIADYVRVVLTIPGGETTGTATFTLTPVDDELAEGPETITVHGTASGLSVDDATLTLNDDDTASTSVSLSVSPASVSEDAGSVSLEVTAALDQQAGTEPTAVNVTVGRAGDTAASGTDYTPVAGFAVTIPAGQTTGTASFTLRPTDDQVAEGLEEITVHGTASGLTVEKTTLTLNDDDSASVSMSLSLSPASVSEDGGARQIEVTAALDGAARLEATSVTVSVGRSGDSAVSGTDYGAVVGFALTIPARERTVTGTFTLTPTDDRIAEGPETITVHGSASGLTVEEATLTLNDDDTASTSVSLSLDTASVSEDDTAQQIEVTAELNQQAGTEPIAVNVTVGRAGDTAASGTDYTPVAGFAVTIAAGQTTGTASFTLRPTDDQVAEGPEEITVQGTASGFTLDDATLTLNDDDVASTSVSLSLDPGSVSEDAGSVSLKVTATLDQQARPEPTAVTLTVGRTGDAAESGTDYTSIADYVRVVLTIPGGETTGTATFTLTPVDDEVAEGPETITVGGTASGLSVEDATLTLNDDDTASTSVSLSVSPASVSEDAGTVSLVVTATLNQAARPELTALILTVGRPGDAAESRTDYWSDADLSFADFLVLTIPAGQTTGTATLTLTPEDDELVEGPETFTLGGKGSGTASGLTVDDVTLTLNDNDTASTSVSLSLDTASVSEDDTAQQIEVTAELNEQAGTEPTAVNVTVGRAGDTAASGTDYTPVAGFVLTIPGGQTTGTATFNLRPTDDQVAEGAEEITVHGTASGLSVEDATLTLNDDDAASTSVSLSLDPGSVSEDAGSVSVEVTAELNGAASSQPTTVNVTVGHNGDSAESGTDYTSVAGFAVTIAAGQTTGTATFSLAPDDDEVAEGAEEITVHGTASGLSVEDATLTLNDDDTASTSISLSLDPGSVSEDAGSVSLKVTATLDQQARPEPTAVTLTVGRTGDAAESGTDYTSIADYVRVVLTIPGGETTGTATFTLTPVDDEVAEGPETITVGGTASGLSVEDATLTLNDDDTASTSVSLSVSPASVSEDAGTVSLAVTAALNQQAGTEPTAVNVTVGRAGDTAASGTDYTPVAGFAVTIAAGQTTGTASFTLRPTDDQVAEGPEEITVQGTASGLTVDDATLTLNDDDAASTSVSLSLDPGSVSEDAGSVSVEVTAALDGAASSQPTTVNVTVGHNGDSAESGTDYTPVAGFAVTIAAGQTTGTATFSLAPEDDQVAEGAEEITVQGTASSLSVDDATLTLNDDDTASTSVSLSLDTASVSEDDTAQQIEVTAELNQQAGTEPTAVNVTVGRAGDTAASGTDYTPVAGFAVTIAAGQTTGTASFTLRPTDDQVAEGPEEITVQGTASGFTVADATLTLNDDDTASTSISLSLDPGSVSEDAGSVSLKVTATLDQQASPEPTAVTLTVGRTGDAAESGTDYTSIADYVRVVLTIPGGQTTGTATFTLTPVDDELAEGPETITVHGTASGLSVDDATLTLNDDDTASTSVSLSLDTASVSEDDTAQQIEVTAELNQQAGTEPTAVNVTVGRAGDTAASGTDYTPVAGFAVTIAAGQTTGTASFTLRPTDDQVAEGPEEITVQGTASGLTVDDATLTLNDDDAASTSVSLSLDPGSVSEDAGSVSVEVTAELNGAAGTEPTAVNVTVGRTGDSAIAGTDYTPVAGFAVTIAAGQTTGTASFTLRPTDDQVAEGPEEITVQGTASGFTVDDATLTLNDDDAASTSVSLSLDPGSVSEDAGSVSVEVTAELNGAAGTEPTAVNVTVGRAGDTAASGTDYTPVAGFAVTIPAGQTTGTASFTLRPTDDQVAEGPEEITVQGTASGFTVDDATLTLNDDDAASTSVSLSLDPGSVSEDAGSVSVEVTAELNGAAGTEPTAVNVTVGRTGDSAIAGTDYTPVAGFAVTIPAGQTTGTASFTLRPTDDQVAEGPEEITVQGTASGFTVDDATLTLNDDDAASTSVSLSLDPGSVSEDAGSVSVEVTAELNGAAGTEPTAVNVTVGRTGDSAASGTDYTPVAGFAVTIPAGQTTGTASFTLRPTDDQVAEGPEEITVQGTASGFTVDDATLTLNDDDAASTSVSLSLDPGSVSEDAGSVSVEVTAALDGAASSQPTTVNVTVGHNGDSAESGTDYTPVAGFAVTIAAGQTTGTATFSLAPNDDEVAEGPEEITVRGTASGFTVDDTTLTLNDDDQASNSVSLSLNPASVSERDGTVTVEVTAELNAGARPDATAVQVSVGVPGDSATSGTDYDEVSSFILQIPPRTRRASETFTLRLTDDAVAEASETITVAGTAAGLQVEPVALALQDNDSASTSFTLSLQPASVSEGGGPASVEVTAALNAGTRSEATTINVSVGDGSDSAAAGTDYEEVAGFSLVIAAESVRGTATFTLTPTNDQVTEPAEQITIQGTADGLPPATVTLEFSDDDSAALSVSLSLSPPSVPENSNSTDVVVTAQLEGNARPQATTVLISVGVPSDAAESGTDYRPVPDFPVVIPAEATNGTATFRLTPIDDQTAEGSETITVDGTSADLDVIEALLTLADDDTAATSATLSVNPASVAEDAAREEIEVTALLDGAAFTEPIEIAVSIGAPADTASSGTDYQAVGDFVLEIPRGTRTATRTFSFRPVDDEIAEGDETIAVNGAAELITVEGAILALNDDDAPSTSVSLSVHPAVAEEGGQPMAIEVTARLNGAPMLQTTVVSVDVGTAGSTAVSGTDFAALAPFPLTILPGNLTGTASFTLTPVPDDVPEGSETIRVNGSAAGLDVEAATLTLRDPRALQMRVPTLQVSLDPESVTEGDGPAEVWVTVEAAGAPSSQDTPVQVSVGAPGDSATAGTDYEEIRGFELTIASGASRGAAAFLLRTLDDEEAEVDEAITVLATLEGANIEPLRSTLYLFDNDLNESPGRDESPPATLEVRIDDATAPEGAGQMHFRVTLDQAAPVPVWVDWSTQTSGLGSDLAEAGADYVDASGTLVIPAGQVEGTISVVLRNDRVDELDERFEVVLWNTSAGVMADDRAVGTIRDDDGPSLTIRDANGAESQGWLEFEVSLSAPSSQPVKGRIVTADRTAKAGLDYDLTNSSFEIAPGGRHYTVRILITDDALHERRETFLVAVRDVQNATITAGEAVGTIEDDDPAPRLFAAPASAKEDDGELIFDVRLTSPSGLESSVIYATADGTATESADYQGVSGMLIFAPGETFTRVRVRVIADVLDEADETFTLEFSEPTHARIGTFAVTATIEDDDAPPRLSAASASAREDDGEMTFDVRLSGASGRKVSVTYATADGTAHEEADYEGVSETLTFAPGETLKKVAVEVIPDVLDEDDETFTLEFSEPTNAILETPAVVGTIRDDDAPPKLTAAPASAREDDGEMSFEVRLSSASGREVSVKYATADGTAHEEADYEGVSETLTFAPGETLKKVVVEVIPDVLDEDDETFTLEFSEPTHARIGTFAVTATIEDDDAPPRLFAASASAREDDGEMTFEVRLSSASGREVSVKYATADGTAHEEADYEGVSETLTFARGETLKKVAVEVIPDVLHEADETFTLEFSEPTNAVLETPAVVGTIRDDDAEPMLRISDARASEQAGVIAFLANLEAVAGRDLHYSFWTTDREALAGEDYEGMRSEFVIPAGETARSVEVRVLDDDADETEETFMLTLDSRRATGAEDMSAVGTIEDDDDNERVARMWITRFGRAVATQVVESVEQRIDDDSRGTRLSLGLVDPMQTVFQAASRGVLGESWGAMRERTGSPLGLDTQNLLGRSSFLVQQETTGTGRDGAWAVWGRGANLRFSGQEDGISVDGNVLTSTIGVDYRRGRLLAGLALANSLGTGGFSVVGSETNGSTRAGAARSRLSTLSPYVSVPLGGRIAVWGLGGLGLGKLSLGADEESADLDMQLAAIGARGQLWAGSGRRNARLIFKTDMFWVKTSADATAVRLGSTGRASRGRVLLEGSRRLGSLWGGEITPVIEAGVRSDGGDAETGLGLEMGTGIRYESPSRLQVELNARSLVVHQDAGYREWGIGGTVRLDRGADRRGLSLAIASSHGNSLSGVNQMWNANSPLAQGAQFADAGSGRLEAEVGYGFGSFAGGPLVPFAGVAWQEGASRAFRIGSRFQLGSSLHLSLEGSRRDGSQYRPDNAFVIRARLR